MTIKETAKSLLLQGVHINKGEFYRQFKTFTLTQRIEEIRKEGWNVKSKIIPNTSGMVEYWLEPQEIERIKNGVVEPRKDEDEQLHFAPLKEPVDEPKKAQSEEYEQLGIGILGGRNYT